MNKRQRTVTILPHIKLESRCRVRDGSDILFCSEQAKKVQRRDRPLGNALKQKSDLMNDQPCKFMLPCDRMVFSCLKARLLQTHRTITHGRS